jgi:hypothetical protein
VIIKIFLIGGKLTLFGVISCVVVGFGLVYLSLEFIPSKWGALLGLCLGLTIAAIGGFSGRANALDLPAPFTNDPLGWRKAKKTYKTDAASEEVTKKDDRD